MAAKRSREKAAGLRRLNVAVKPEMFDKLAELMKVHSCTSQAKLIEFLIMHNSPVLASRKLKERRNEVTDKKEKPKRKASSKKQPLKIQKEASFTKAPKSNTKVVTAQKELLPTQMSLFES
jgi:hypothetical protein